MIEKDKQYLTARTLKRWRELRRDMLYLRFGDNWQEHDGRAFFAGPTDAEKEELCAVMALSCGDA
jgi:hypothetical protein